MPIRAMFASAVLLMLLPLIIWAAHLQLPVLIPPPHIPAFHLLVEVFAVVVATLVFATGFHVLDRQRARASVLLACAFLGIGLLDLLHILSYPGMHLLDPAHSHHQTVIFWLAARLMAAASILAYVLLPYLNLDHHMPRRQVLLLGSMGMVALIVYVGLHQPQWVPATFDPELGLTPFKIGAEWVVITLHIATLAVIGLQWRIWPPDKSCYLAGAMVLFIGSELYFTLYTTMTDSFFVLGHIYKVLAYLLIYKCMFLDSITEPLVRLDQANRELASNEKHIQKLIDTAPDGVVVADQDGLIVLANRNMHGMFGYAPETMIGEQLSKLLLKRGEGEDAPGPHPITSHLAACGATHGCRMDNVAFPIDIRSTGFNEENKQHTTYFVRDITDQVEQKQALQHQAMHDALTGLPNRVLFHRRLAQCIADCKRDGSLLAIALFDLDQFKLVNDRFGHLVGDELIVATANRLSTGIRASDTAARIGGDEFVVLLPGLPSRETALVILEQIIARLTEPLVVSNGQSIPGNASVGISFAPQDSCDSLELLRFADMAMFQAKRQQRGSYSVFTPTLDEQLQQDLQLIDRLRLAMATDGLELHYQPQIDTRDGTIIGAEALLRWHDPELGHISPALFIPLAERSDLITQIDSLVLCRACQQIASWQAAGTPLPVSVNLSAQQFCARGLEQRITEVLRATGAPAALLEIEITENAAMENLALAQEQLQKLRRLGVSIALDDFGTGHSSLSHLGSLPINKLKIDRMFLAKAVHSATDESLLRTIISLGQNLGMQVLAEGVETLEQLALIRQTGCSAWQGWLAYPSLTAEQLTKLINKPASVRDSHASHR